MLANLALAAATMLTCVIVHFFGLLGLLRLLRVRSARLRHWSSVFGQATILITIVFGLMLIHSVEAWIYAGIYIALGEIEPTADAFAFSIGMFTTVGADNIETAEQWREFAVSESVTGLILFGWSTATFQHHWMDEAPGHHSR
jgi:hypothetical protein